MKACPLYSDTCFAINNVWNDRDVVFIAFSTANWHCEVL